jgi:hypothetical protein
MGDGVLVEFAILTIVRGALPCGARSFLPTAKHLPRRAQANHHPLMKRVTGDLLRSAAVGFHTWQGQYSTGAARRRRRGHPAALSDRHHRTTLGLSFGETLMEISG